MNQNTIPREAEHRLELSVVGLSCAGDAAPVAARLKRIPGVLDALVNPITEHAVVCIDPALADVSEIFRVLDGIGIGVTRRLVRRHFEVPGGTCPHCGERLEAALRRVDGIEAVVLNVDEGNATVEYVPNRLDDETLREALTTAAAASCKSEGV
ncbi:MAG: cation transporter [Gemmatimonadota bacterium]